MQFLKGLLWGLLTLILIGVLLVVGFSVKQTLSTKSCVGSVNQANEYNSTSTSYLSATLASVIVSGPGALGSVVITGANTGSIIFYDATTTNVNLRTNQAATNTIILGTIPASLAAGTYTFDTYFQNGLLAEKTGLMPTSTITFRSY